MSELAVIIPAAGSSSRFGGGRNKLLEDLHGAAVIVHSVRAFRCRSDVRLVVVATDSDQVKEALGDVVVSAGDRVCFCAGGASRAHSVRNALDAVPADVEWVAVHDAARPLVSQELIDRTLAVARLHGAAVPAQAVALTIKEARGPLPARVERTVPRQNLWAMQTPQIARREALVRAFAACPIPLDQVTDDMQLIEVAGGDVWLVPGDERNLKITTAPDMELARLLMANRLPR